MLPIRIHVVTIQDLLGKKKEPVREWRLSLPETIVASDASRIAYVLQYEDEGSARLFRVKNIVFIRARQFSGGRDRFSLELEESRWLTKETVEQLFLGYEPGKDLDESFVKQLENWLHSGPKVDFNFHTRTPLLRALTFDEAKIAISNYYSVDKEQVKIKIVG